MSLKMKSKVKTIVEKRQVHTIEVTGEFAAAFYAIIDLAASQLDILNDANMRDEKDGRIWTVRGHCNKVEDFLRQVDAGRPAEMKKLVLEKAPPGPLS